MFAKNRVLIDASAAALLVLALLLVMLVDRFTSGRAPVVPQDTLQVRVLDSGARANSKKLRLALTPSHQETIGARSFYWDDMGKLLHELGDGYRFDTLAPQTILRNPRVLDAYDVLFLTCAPDGRELRASLANFVARGGTLYASDWRFEAVAEAFPDYVDFRTAGEGLEQELVADVVDVGLRDYVGPNIPLRFDLPRWKTAAFGGPRVTTLVQGRYLKQRHKEDTIGMPALAPLLVKFTVGKGTVIFTSFHNEKQNSELEKKLLQYLVFSAVTADIDTQVTESIRAAGFVAERSNLLSTPKNNPSVTRTHSHAKSGPLRFSLGFRNEDALLRLTLQSPEGQTYSWQGTSTVALEVPDASPGDWQYTVSALRLPYENFPFTVTVSEKK